MLASAKKGGEQHGGIVIPRGISHGFANHSSHWLVHMEKGEHGPLSFFCLNL